MAKFKKKQGPPRTPVHGTIRGYNWHRHWKIPYCSSCRRARALWMAEYRSSGRASFAPWMIGCLYVNASIEAQELIDASLARGVVDRCVAAFDAREAMSDS